MPKKGGKGKRAARKALQLLKKRTRALDELAREVKYVQHTYKLHERKWRQLMLKISLPKVREDLKYTWQIFERAIDVKDYTISLLMDDLDFASEQQMMKARNHITAIDGLVKLFHGQVEDMEASYTISLQGLKDEAKLIEDLINTTSQEDEMYMKVMMYGLEQVGKKNEKEIKGEHVTKLNDIITNFKEQLGNMSYARENRFETMFQDTLGFSDKYFHTTAERRGQYLKLFNLDTSTRGMNSERYKRIFKMQEVIRRLKQRFADLQDRKQLKISDLKQERQFFQDNYSELTVMMRVVVRMANRNLRHLVVTSNDTMTHLKRLQKKGEQLLKMMMVCSKEQTLSESIYHFPMYQPCLIQDSEKLLERRKPDIFDAFWLKLASADTSRLVLMNEKETLLKENRMLKMKMLKYCRCIECPTLPPIVKENAGNLNVTSANDVLRNYSLFHGVA